MNLLLIFLLIGISVGVIAFLHTSNLEKKKRYKQDLVAMVIPVLALFFFGLERFNSFNSIETWMDTLLFDAGISSNMNLSLGTYFVYLCFVALMYPVKRGLIHLRTKGSFTDDNSFATRQFYKKKKKEKQFFLKDKYYYPLHYLRASIIVFSILLIFTFMVILLDKVLPAYVFLVLYFLLEFYWFMNGAIREKYEEEKIEEEEEPETLDYFGLWKKYQSIWGENLLQAFLQKPTPKSIRESYTLEDESLIINYKQNKIFDTIYHKIVDTINKGKTIVIFIPDHFQPTLDIEKSEQFEIIYEILFQEEYINQFYTTKIDDLKRDKRIFINSIDQFLDMKLNIEQDNELSNWFEDLGMVLYFGYDRSLIESPESTVSVSSILKYLCQYPEDLTTIVFAEEKQNSQPAFTSNIKVNTGFNEIRIQDTTPRLVLFLNWKRECSYEYGLFDAHYNKLIGPIASLMPLPYIYGVRSISVRADSRPYIENFENLKKDKDTWVEKYDVFKGVDDRVIDDYVNFKNHNLSFEHRDEDVILLDNYLNNAPLLFKYFNGFVKKVSLIQLFSSPHILRKYFNEHFEFFTESPIFPLTYLLLKEDRTTLALSLLEKLSKCKLTLKELYNDFNETNVPRKIVLSQIRDLFMDVFEFDIINSDYLEISEDANGEFLFSLKPDIKDHIELYRSVKFYDENNQLVFKKNKHLLFQRYSEGQYHSFNGRMFEINRIFNDGEDITIKLNNKEPHKNYVSYTEKRVVQINRYEESDCLRSNTLDQTEFSIHVFNIGYSVYTNGYFEFDSNGFSLNEGDYTFHKSREIKTREYKNGRFLRLRLKKAKVGDLKGIITIRILFEEYCRILFPDSYPFLIFRYFKPSTDATTINMDKSISNYYQLSNAFQDDENFVGIHIFEDSIFDMGHLRSIKDNIHYIFQLMEDYLSYTIDTVGTTNIKSKKLKEHKLPIEEQFLGFGLKEVNALSDFPDPIDIEKAKAIISSTLRNTNPTVNRNQLTNNRISFYEVTAEVGV